MDEPAPLLIRTKLTEVDDNVVLRGIQGRNVYEMFGHSRSAKAREDFSHHLCVAAQTSQNPGNENWHKVLYVDLSRACSFRPDKLLKVTKSNRFMLDPELVLKRVTYGRISHRCMLSEVESEQRSLIGKIDSMIRDSPGGAYSLIVINDLNLGYDLQRLFQLAEEKNLAVVINRIDDAIFQDDDQTQRVVLTISNLEFSTSIRIAKEKELRFPSKGFSGDKIGATISNITEAQVSFGCLINTFDLWTSAVKHNKLLKKKDLAHNSLFLAFIHLLLNVCAFSIEQLLEFRFKDNKKLLVAGLVTAVFGVLFWLWEKRLKWNSREKKWYTWPLFPATIGLILELNAVAFYSGSSIHPRKPPRLVVAAVLFHISHIIEIMGKAKRKELKRIRISEVV